jgi:molybdopterin converting factor small subunit
MPGVLLDYGRYTNEILAPMTQGMIRYWAAAREAAGVPEEGYEATTLAEALENARRARDVEFARVLSRSSFLIDGAPVGTRSHASVDLPEGGIIEVLPPFAGG